MTIAASLPRGAEKAHCTAALWSRILGSPGHPELCSLFSFSAVKFSACFLKNKKVLQDVEKNFK